MKVSYLPYRNEYWKPLNYMKVSYLRYSYSYFSGIMAILNLQVSYHLNCKTNIFLWAPIFAYFIDGQTIKLGKKTFAVKTYENSLAISFLTIWVSHRESL